MNSKFLTICAIFFSLVLTTTSCSSDDDGGGGSGGLSPGTFRANIDGAGFDADIATSGNLVQAGPSQTMTLLGTDAQGKAINLIINGYEGEGTYDIGGANLVFVVGSYTEANASNPLDTQSWSAPYDNDSVRGTMSISSDSGDNVQGTFEFTAKNPNDGSVKNITDGEFNLDYTTF